MRMSDPEEKQSEMEPVDIGNEASSQAMDAALQSSFVILKVVIAVLAVYLVFSNTFSVVEGKQGAIILRFGESRTSTEDVWKPGIRFAWPFPIEERVIIDAVSPVTTAFAWTQYPKVDDGMPEDDPSKYPNIVARDPRQGYLLTKDNKAIHLKAEMRYEVTDFDRFVFGFYKKDENKDEPTDAERTLEHMLESALTHAAYERTLEEILNPNRIPKEASDRDTFQKKVEKRVAILMEQYDLGVKLKDRVTISFGNSEEMESIPVGRGVEDPASPEPQPGARKSRKKFTEQASDTVKRIKDAEREARMRYPLPSKSGELAIIAKQAENEKKALLQSLEATAKRFDSIYEKFSDPAARRRHMEELYYQTITRIAKDTDVKIYLVPKGDENQPTRLRLQINQPPPKRNNN